MADYSVQFDGLEQATQQMATISRQINDFLEQLQSGTMKSIVEWESGARDLFDQQRGVWATGAADMATQAVTAQNALNHIIELYANGEKSGIQLWGHGV